MLRKFIAGSAVITGALALTLMGVAQAQAEPATGAMSELSSREASLYQSDKPKTIQIDPATGQVLSVSEGMGFEVQAIKNNCSGDVACWNGRPPALNYGFSGSGSSGSWPHRASFQTKNYTATVCWSYEGTTAKVCTPEHERAGKNSKIEFGQNVTGRSVSLKR